MCLWVMGCIQCWCEAQYVRSSNGLYFSWCVCKFDLEDDCRTSLRLCWPSLPVVRVVMTDYHESLGMGLGWSSTRHMVSPFASSVRTFVYLAFISALHHIPTEYQMFLNILFQAIHWIKSQTITNIHKLHSKLIQTICCLIWRSIGNCYTCLSGNLQRVEIISL